MRIDRLRVENFRGFEKRTFEFERSLDAKPEGGNGSFHLLIGDNATGKTGVLEALSVALGSFTNAFPDAGKRNFKRKDVRIVLHPFEDTERIEQQLPVEVEATASTGGKQITWMRQLRNKRVRTAPDKAMREYADKLMADSRKDPGVVLPVISYFGTERLHSHPKDVWSKDQTTNELLKPSPMGRTPEGGYLYSYEKVFQSRLAGYWFANDARTSPDLMQKWFKLEHDLSRDRGRESLQFTIVKDAVKACIVDCEEIKVDARLGILIKTEHHGLLPFDLLSDGQKVIAATVGELALKAAQLNPVLNRSVLLKTPGIVLIDEIDLHLHPKWQRRIVECLRTVFPEVQFIVTSHSPFIVQSMHENEVQQLDVQMGTIPTTANRDIETITEGLMMPPSPDEPIDETAKFMGVMEPDTSAGERYHRMKADARTVLELLDKASKTSDHGELEAIRAQVTRAMSDVQDKYADNPAYQAYLEMKRTLVFGASA